MRYAPGKYLILQPCYWIHSKATIITIVEIKENKVYYYYDSEEYNVRWRFDMDFVYLGLAPSSPLIEELI
jgi:hypothetical protein